MGNIREVIWMFENYLGIQETSWVGEEVERAKEKEKHLLDFGKNLKQTVYE